jgi:MYXO-CTERM domain-containing protein
MSGLDWFVIALGATGGATALLAVAVAAAHRRRRRTALAAVTARGRTRLPETRIEVVAINDADPERHSSTIERK